VDWRQPAGLVARRIRALSPFPGAWCNTPAGRLKLLDARAVGGAGAPGEVLDKVSGGLTIACGKGAVTILRAQREGKRPMEAAELLRGIDLPSGLRLDG